MKYATLSRGPSTDEGTFGRLVCGDGPELVSLELPWRDNKPQASSIPPGFYRCEIVDSPKFGRVYGVQDVRGRSHILIHAANFAGDVSRGWKSELLGCIAPVTKAGTLPNGMGRDQRAGISSKAALKHLMEWAGGQPFELEIR
jgi:hypothetical protein